MTDTAYARWARGDCCCCGAELEPSVNDVACKAIGEGVLICGRCAENEHDRPLSTVRPADSLLEAIAVRHDGPIERDLGRIKVNRP